MGLFNWFAKKNAASGNLDLRGDDPQTGLPKDISEYSSRAVDENPTASSPVNYWVQVYLDLDRATGNLMDFIGVSLSKDDRARMMALVERIQKDHDAFGDLIYKGTHKELLEVQK
jgi:hypothetical protein